MIFVRRIIFVVIILICATALLGASIPSRLRMRNSDIIECNVTMERISFISDYGEFQMPMEFVKAIVFPTSGTIITSLKTIYKNEIFRGFLLSVSQPLLAHLHELRPRLPYLQDGALILAFLHFHPLQRIERRARRKSDTGLYSKESS